MEELKKINRRSFIKAGGIVGAAFALNLDAFDAFAAGKLQKLTILHTNDVHSRIEPFPMDGSRNQGLAGTARRAALIKQIRQEQEHVLLLDAGDIFQGTPYFNKYGGELEFKIMSMMKYDASTLGNHDFDNGLEGFYKQLPHAEFPFLISNYDFSNTILSKSTQPYKIFKKGGLTIGVFGIGIALSGLVDPKNYGDTIVLDPIKKANEMASLLKQELKCDLVICLSHLGYRYRDHTVSDQVLAKQTKHIDLIIGGHTHSFMEAPEDIRNLEGKVTTINQVGFAGINLGRIDYYFEPGKGNKTKIASPYEINNKLDS